jgi:tyrosyl-tRNA synthetase
MSKSLGNYVGIEDPPREIYGKLMSISDDLMWRYYELCTDVSTDGIDQLKRMVQEGGLHPKKAKEGLALRIVSDFHGEAAARESREEFERVFRDRGTPDDIPEHRFAAEQGKVFLPKLLLAAGLSSSRTEANRMLSQGAVSVDGEKLAAGQLELEAHAGDQLLFKVGKRRFARVTID